MEHGDDDRHADDDDDDDDDDASAKLRECSMYQASHQSCQFCPWAIPMPVLAVRRVTHQVFRLLFPMRAMYGGLQQAGRTESDMARRASPKSICGLGRLCRC